MSEIKKPKLTFRQRLTKALWLRVPVIAFALIIGSFGRAIFQLLDSGSRGWIASSLYAFPWLMLGVGAIGLLIWRLKQKEIPGSSPDGTKALREPGARRRWTLWALGIRTPGSDSQYGPRLARYRRWSSLPVAIMSITVFVLILGKLYFAYLAITATMSTFNEDAVVAQYMGGMTEAQIITDFMQRLAGSVFHASPLWLQLPLLILWLLAFVIDFIVAATLAENKKLWWKRHWGGIITAFVTLP